MPAGTQGKFQALSHSASHIVFSLNTQVLLLLSKDANSNLQIHDRVNGNLFCDLSSHQLNKNPTLFACRASILPGDWLCRDAQAASPGVDVTWELSSGALCMPVPPSLREELHGSRAEQGLALHFSDCKLKASFSFLYPSLSSS